MKYSDITNELAELWAEDMNTNPLTGKHIKTDGPTYKLYERYYAGMIARQEENNYNESDDEVENIAEDMDNLNIDDESEEEMIYGIPAKNIFVGPLEFTHSKNKYH